MIVDYTGIRPAPSKIEAVSKMPRPKTVYELRAFLALTGYLRQFVPGFSIVAVPLTDLLPNKAFATKCARKSQIEWGDAQEQAFVKLKAELTSPVALAFPDWGHEFTLRTGALEVGAGAVLDQIMGEETFHIAFASRRFSSTSAKRAPTERDCLAVLWAVGHFRMYLAGRRFTLITECSALMWLFKSRDLSPKLHRWALQLMEYDFVLQWRPGVLHSVPMRFPGCRRMMGLQHPTSTPPSQEINRETSQCT